jgi:uncharacterized membrane protein
MPPLVAFANLVCGLLMGGLSLPLIYRKVGMNHLYGIRIPEAFESEQRWYDINAYGGRCLAIGSLPVIAVGAIGFFVPAESRPIYLPASLVVILLSVFVPVTLTLRWSRKKSG